MASLLRSVLGRKTLTRIGRFLLNSGRLDAEGDQEHNGEYKFIQAVLERSLQSNRTVVMFDIGANKGLATGFASRLLGSRGRIYAVEPCRETFQTLRCNIATLSSDIRPINAAFSDRDGIGTLQVVGPNAGTNSLVDGIVDAVETENVELVRLDTFADRESVDQIDFVKVDTEGHDFPVLKGCRSLLNEKKIAAIQFEYNWRWIGQRFYLRDCFDLIAGMSSYKIGKVTSRGIEIYDKWRPEIETLIENNYAILREDRLADVTIVRPWYS